MKVTPVEPHKCLRENRSYSPLKANMEPFFICMKASKGFPLQTTASGSGASVVPVATATVVVASGVASTSGALVLTSSAAGSTCDAAVEAKVGLSGREGRLMSSEDSGRRCGLRPKSVAGFRDGLSRRLSVGSRDGEAPSSGSSS